MADARDSKSRLGNKVWVQVPPPVVAFFLLPKTIFDERINFSVDFLFFFAKLLPLYGSMPERLKGMDCKSIG